MQRFPVHISINILIVNIIGRLARFKLQTSLEDTARLAIRFSLLWILQQ
jgi:hypothetical protein